MKNHYLIILVLVFFTSLLLSCRHHPALEKIEGNPPANLIYSPNSIQIMEGNIGSSPIPSIEGDTTISYAITTTPLTSSTKVFIDAQGVIHIDSTLQLGTYDVTVIASNTSGNTSFPNAFTFEITDVATPPSNLVYNPSLLTLNDGELGTSVIPTFSGTSPITFSISTTPTNSNIVISNTGEISVTDTIPAGSYQIDVTATNAAGSVVFTNVYGIDVTEVAPFNLVYTPNSISIAGSNVGASPVPTVEGTLPITYTFTSSPSNANISIDPNSGVISSATTLPVGSYSINVTATNTVGSVDFNSIFTINKTATSSPPSNLVYNPNSLTLNQGDAGNSVTPTISGTTPMSYSLSSSPASSSISINSSTGVITSGPSTPPGTYDISVTAINSVSSVNFTNVYTITIIGATLPSNLVYNPNSLSLTQGNAGSSVTPSVSGTQPITYTHTVTPATTGITINSTTGVISANSSVPANTYSVDVHASNAAGTTDFTAIYSFDISAASLISFANDILPIITNKCNNCHTTGPQTIYTNYTNAFNNATVIYDRVTRTSGSAGAMPKNQPSLLQAEQDLILQWINDGKQP